MGDPIAAQFGALDKLMKESAEADMRKRVALQRFQLGQEQAKMLAQQEMEQHQAEEEGAQQAAQSQQQPVFQLQLPTNGAISERPVQWKNPLSQLAGNAYSAMAQAGAEGPGAAIQEQLRAAGAVPGAMDQMLQGLNVMGPTSATTQTDVGVSPQAIGQQGFAMVPTMNQRTTESPNALSANDIATLRARLLDRILAEQGGQRAEGPKVSPEVFRQTMKDLNDQYGEKIPASLKSQIAKATAMGDLETAEQLSAGLPAPKADVDPLRRQAAMAELKDAQKGFEQRDLELDNKQSLRQNLVAARDVLERGMAQTGVIRGSKLGELVQRLGATDETSVNVLQQAFSEQWVQSVQGMRGLGALSDQEGKALAATTGGLNKSIDFNLTDLNKRIAILDSQIKRADRGRTLAAKTRDSILETAGLGKVVPDRPEREEADLDTAVERQPEAAPDEINSLLDKGAPQ